MTLLAFLIIPISHAQTPAKKKQATSAKRTLPSKPISTTPKIDDGSIVVKDSIFSNWSYATAYAGVTNEKMISDSKGNIYAYASYQDTGVYKLVNGKWVIIGERFTTKDGKLFLDAKDVLYLYVDKRVYKLSGNEWLPAWDTEIPQFSFIGMDGNAYRRDSEYDTPLFKWINGAWEKVCEPLLSVYIDKNGRVYTQTTFEESKTRKEKIKYWEGNKWNYMIEDYVDKIALDRKYLYVVTSTAKGYGKRQRVIKRWDGINWTTIPLPHDSTIRIDKLKVDQFGNILLHTSHGEYFSIKGSPFTHIDHDYEVYQTSSEISILNDKAYSTARTNAGLVEYKPSWTVYNTTLYSIPVKPGVKPSPTLQSIQSRWKMYKGKYGWGIRTLDRKDIVFAEFDSIRIEETPEGSNEDLSLYMKRLHNVVHCSIYISDPWALRGFKEKDMGDCYPCSGGFIGEYEVTTEKRGEYVKGKTYTTSKPRSSGGYTETTTTEAGYYKPSTYSTKTVGKREKCRAPKCKEGRIVHKQVWKHKTFYTEMYE